MAMQESYDQYYATGYYDQRYPTANGSTLERTLAVTPPGGASILDIGAGNGRYAVILASRGYVVNAVEPSDYARAQLRHSSEVRKLESQIVVFKELADVPSTVVANSHLAMLQFGVLGHMCYIERMQVLGRLMDEMPSGSAVVGSVPNRFRRFRAEQRTGKLSDTGSPPRFKYSRTYGGIENDLEYTAFSPADLRQELASAGWADVALRCESFFSESMVTRSNTVSRIDRTLTRVAPAMLGYCIWYAARKP